MAEYIDNPAGRLQQWVSRFQLLPNKDTPISEALASMIGEDHSTVRGRVESIRFAMRLAELADEVRAEAALLPEHVDADVLLEDFNQFDRVFDQMTIARQTRVADMLGQVDAAAIRSLDLLSRQLHRYRPEATLDENVRTTLIAAIKQLRRQVAEDVTLDSDVRDFILTRFGDVERVLLDAPATGSGPVERVTDSIVGSIQRQPRVWQRIAESVFAEAVAGVVAGLFLTLVSPPAPDALPPGTPASVVNIYVDVLGDLPEGGATPEVIQGVVVLEGEPSNSLPSASEDDGDAARPDSE